MEECVFSGDDESQMTSVSYTPRSGEFELSDNFIILESDEKSNFRSKCDTYETSASFFCRLLSLVYFFSFLSNMNQVLGLFGSSGIYDIYSNTTTFLNNLSTKSFYEALSEFPSVFLVMPISDFTLKLVPLVGMVSAFLMFLTGFNCMYSFLFLWILKLSVVALFKTLPRTMSDLLLLEVGFLAIFVFSPFKFFDRHSNFDVPTLVKWSFRFLTYRIVLLSGVYKVFLLKKMNIQHILMSIPLPTFFNYYLVGLVSNFKFFNVVFTTLLIFFEVVLSVFLVTPYRSCRLFGGIGALIYSLVFTLLGNFGPFYILLMLSSLFCLDDQFLSPFVDWKYNPFCKSDVLMRKVSVDLVDNIFDNYPQSNPEGADLETGSNSNNNKTKVRNGVMMVDNSPDNMGNSDNDNSDNDSENASFGSVYFDRILSNLNYSRHREYIREFMNIDNKLSNNMFSECFKKVLKDLLLLFYLVVIIVLSLLLFLFHNYRGLKALLLFAFCILLKSHCETVKTKITFLQGQYTLFILQGLLVFEMLKNGPNTWSFLLWVGLIELQLSLSKKIDNVSYLARMIIQSFLFVHLILYNTRIFHSSFKELLVRPKSNFDSNNYNYNSYNNYYNSSGNFIDYGASLNSFYSINNYKNVYPVNNERFEVVLQGTSEHYVTVNSRWYEFEFKRKPSRLNKFPHFVPFYEYTLDEQLVTTFNTKYYSKLFRTKNRNKHNRVSDTDEVVKKKYVVNHLNKDNLEDELRKSTEDSEFLENENTDNSNYDNNLESSDSNSNSNTNGSSNNNLNDNNNNFENNNTNGNYLDNGVKKNNQVKVADKYIFDLMKTLLSGSQDVNQLLSNNPFGNGKPVYMRVMLYKYYFNSLPRSENDRRDPKNWYYREFVDELVPPLSYTPTKVNFKDHDNTNGDNSNSKDNKEVDKNKSSSSVVSGSNNTTGSGNTNSSVNVDKLENKLQEHTNHYKDNSLNGVEHLNEFDRSNENQVVHVVHTMPASNRKTVPLNMADNFNHKIPNVDGMVITTK